MGRLAAGWWVFVDHPHGLRMSEGKERSPAADRKHVAGYNAAAPDLSNNDPIRSMRNSARAFLLGPLLKGVSRSFYLTLRILPAGMRDPIGLGYLLARAADTIADTSLIPPEQRLELLLSLRSQVNGVSDEGALARIAVEVAGRQTQSDEKHLLESLGPALTVLSQLSESDQEAVREIVTTLTEGMEFDLRTFPNEYSGQIVALQELDELDRYTYMVAGCVGEFWTKMTYAHMPGTLKDSPETMLARGIRFGKALQMTNVLRDCGKDLRIGRCYLPATMLDRSGLSPQDLLLPDASRRARPLMFELVHGTLDHFREALEYTFAIPAFSVQLRLACLWPILIGLETLLLLVNNDDWLDPDKVSKIPRSNVYRVMAYSVPLVPSNSLLRSWVERLIGRVEAGMKG
ncbi:MAG: Squalene/phytoene synthase [Caballeronia mineralivorans]|jgi:farnesyl-diphosphate farnesyltransferase|nr:Squalene/phytoene synthase [Caballeronia mineralivorans]MEA3101520.1 farnesyl-diphosphate farnesyltransferase [Caballeronia mineralivorans]